MDRMGEAGNTANGWFGTFMSDKPLWAFLIVHIVLAGLGFGLLYTAMYYLGLRWWVAAITVFATGGLWGFSAYRLKRDKSA